MANEPMTTSDDPSRTDASRDAMSRRDLVATLLGVGGVAAMVGCNQSIDLSTSESAGASDPVAVVSDALGGPTPQRCFEDDATEDFAPLKAPAILKIGDGVFLRAKSSLQPAPDFIGLVASQGPFGEHVDPAVQIGFNIATNGFPEDPRYGTVAWGYEGNYQGGVETYLVFGTKDGRFQNRSIGCNFDHTTGASNISILVTGTVCYQAAQHRIFNNAGTAGLDMQFNEYPVLEFHSLDTDYSVQFRRRDPGKAFRFGTDSDTGTFQIASTGGLEISGVTPNVLLRARVRAVSNPPNVGIVRWQLNATYDTTDATSAYMESRNVGGNSPDCEDVDLRFGVYSAANEQMEALRISPIGHATFAGDVAIAAGHKLDLGALSATDAALKVAPTSDTPTGASTTYLKVLVGSTPFYIALKAAS